MWVPFRPLPACQGPASREHHRSSTTWTCHLGSTFGVAAPALREASPLRVSHRTTGWPSTLPHVALVARPLDQPARRAVCPRVLLVVKNFSPLSLFSCLSIFILLLHLLLRLYILSTLCRNQSVPAQSYRRAPSLVCISVSTPACVESPPRSAHRTLPRFVPRILSKGTKPCTSPPPSSAPSSPARQPPPASSRSRVSNSLRNPNAVPPRSSRLSKARTTTTSGTATRTMKARSTRRRPREHTAHKPSSVLPLTQGGQNTRNGWGASLFDALDTLYVMGFKVRVQPFGGRLAPTHGQERTRTTLTTRSPRPSRSTFQRASRTRLVSPRIEPDARSRWDRPSPSSRRRSDTWAACSSVASRPRLS